MITVSGIGSGLDIVNLVSQLVAAEGAPKTSLYDTREAGIQAKITAFASIKSALSTFQSSLAKLRDVANFQGKTVTSGDSEVFFATASTVTVPGTFSVEVSALAEAQKLISQSYTDSDSEVGTGTLTITVGATAVSINIDSENNSLAGIRDAINSNFASATVTATIINVEEGGETISKLILTAGSTGLDNKLTVTVDDDDNDDVDSGGLSALAYDPDAGPPVTNLTELRAAVDAAILLDGQTVTSDNNTISGAIEGLTITLLKASPGEPFDLTIANDEASISSAISGFVASYNGLISTLNSLTSYNVDTSTASVLIGDSTLRSIENQIRRIIASPIAGLGEDMNSLLSLGITTGDDGTLVLDNDVLGTALSGDVDDVAKVFTGTDGYAVRLDDLIDNLIGTGGIVNTRLDGFDLRLDDINDLREALDRRLEKIEIRLLAQFSALDAMIATLNTTSEFLTIALASLPEPLSFLRK